MKYIACILALALLAGCATTNAPTNTDNKAVNIANAQANAAGALQNQKSREFWGALGVGVIRLFTESPEIIPVERTVFGRDDQFRK